MGEIEKYLNSFDEVELRNNFEGIVRSFNERERSKASKGWRNGKNPRLKPFSIGGSIFGGGTFDEYKEEFERRINSKNANKADVIKYFRKKYIDTLLGDRRLKKIYDNFSAGGVDKHVMPLSFSKNDMFLFYTNKHKVEEIMKFEDYLNDIEHLDKATQGEKSDVKPIVEFKDLFEKKDEFDAVVKELSKVMYIDSDTLVWKDFGNGYKSLASALVKFIHTKGYLKTKPKDSEILAILKNTFKIDIGIDTIKRAKPDKFDFSKLEI